MSRPLLREVPARIAGVSRWRRVGLALGAIAAVATAIGVLVSTSLPGSSRGASPPRKGSATATVQRRDLVATDTEAGTLGYANPQTVFNRLSGTITSLPQVGAVIKPGQTLYGVSGSPVVMFNGTVPAYRNLAAGVGDGLDVQQLKANLVALGFDPNHQITINQTFDAATTAAVESWQASLGETQTGTVTLGQIVFLPGVQRVTAVDTVLGSTGGAGSGGAGSSGTGSSGTGSSGTTGSSSSSGASPAGASTGASTTAAGGSASLADARPPDGQPRTTFVSLTTATSPSVVAAACPTGGSSIPGRTTPGPSTPRPSTSGPASEAPSGACTTLPATSTTTPSAPSPGVGRKPTAGSGRPTAIQLLAQLVAAFKKLAAVSSRAPSTVSRGGSSPASSSAGAGGGTRSSAGAQRSNGSAGAGSTAGATGSTGGTSSTTGSASAQAILQTTSNQIAVSVQLDATKQSEATVREPVTVQLPDGTTVDGRITKVSPVAQTSSSSSGSSSGGAGGAASGTPSATIPVTIALTGHQPISGLDQAAVSVNFEQQKQNNVLSVPVTALLATPGGGYAVQEASAPHSLIPVTPGLFAASFVQVSGSRIYPGLQVTDSQG